MGQSIHPCRYNSGRDNDFASVNNGGVSICFANNFDMIQFLSLSFEGPAKWFFLGIVFYLIFIVAIAVTAIFYIHLEINLRRQISGLLNVLAWIHLIGMNIGGPLTTLLMII